MEDEQLWPNNILKETAQILYVRTVPKNKDAFGQIAYAEIVVKAPFRYIDDPTIKTSRSKSTELPVLRDRVTRVFQTNTLQEEFEQQHRAHRGQKFAVLRLMQTSSRLIKNLINGKYQHLPRVSILIIESTHEADKWRRVGLFGISVPIYPDEDDLDLQFMNEMKRAKWEWKCVTIV